ncbi:colicin release lysis protein, partial [Escherichia coli]|uniref:colicin release lysis protein n=1 Tax=Escherichia coli TaxID=562 RepID=UPI0024140C6F
MKIIIFLITILFLSGCQANYIRDVQGVSLDIGNYCTLRLFFNQAQLLYSGSKCDKSGKYYICLVSCF